MCKLPEGFKFSFSSLTSYEHCPMGFKLHYIDKVESSGNGFSDYGTLCHKLLEEYAKNQTPMIALAEEYESRFDKEVINSFPPYPKGMGQKYYDAGLKYFEEFDGFGDEWEIISVEEKFELDIEGYTIIGLADLVLKNKNTGEIMVVDHKSKSASSMKKELNVYRKQLYIYAMYVKDRWGVWPSILRFNMFKEGFNIDEEFDESMV